MYQQSQQMLWEGSRGGAVLPAGWPQHLMDYYKYKGPGIKYAGQGKLPPMSWCTFFYLLSLNPNDGKDIPDDYQCNEISRIFLSFLHQLTLRFLIGLLHIITLMKVEAFLPQGFLRLHLQKWLMCVNSQTCEQKNRSLRKFSSTLAYCRFEH